MLLCLIILLLVLYIFFKNCQNVENFKCLRKDYFIDPENRCKDIKNINDCNISDKCSWNNISNSYKYPLFIKENYENYPEPRMYDINKNKYDNYCEANLNDTNDNIKKDFCKNNYLKCPNECKNACNTKDFYNTGFCIGAPHHKTSDQCCNDYGSQNGYRFISP